ncbi:aminotransferase class IV [Flammeovirgaceae bacterium SG7u.111]|nr:aminotransferase class IV [Flammeovirgaceae bacterium SG7u.132]WPO33143.1 aminotransferase class IV [Flammeovirgaceae bacterium SG7u.111]
MVVSFNYKLIDNRELEIPFVNRAFKYGDGLFESIMFKNDSICYLSDHIKRLKKGMTALRFEGVDGIKKDIIEHQIWELVKRNHVQEGGGRIKIQVWRKDGGLYIPDNYHFNLFISIDKTYAKPQSKRHLKNVDFSTNVTIFPTNYSRFKTCNSLPYVMAGIEKQHRGLDEVILLDHKGNISECSSSNIFWVKKNKVFTPKLSTGCIAGVARKNIIKKLRKEGVLVTKTKSKGAELLNADSVFISNVSSIKHINAIKNKKFSTWNLIDEILEKK